MCGFGNLDGFQIVYAVLAYWLWYPCSSRFQVESFVDIMISLFFCFKTTFREVFCTAFSAFRRIQQVLLPCHSEACWFGGLVSFGGSIQAQPRVMFHRFFQKKYVVVWPFLKIVRYSNCHFLHNCFIRFAPLRRYGLLQTLRSFSSLIVRRSVELAMSNPGQVPD